MIKILKSLKYDKTQYDKHFGIFYHMTLSKYDKKTYGAEPSQKFLTPTPPRFDPDRILLTRTTVGA